MSRDEDVLSMRHRPRLCEVINEDDEICISSMGDVYIPRVELVITRQFIVFMRHRFKVIFLRNCSRTYEILLLYLKDAKGSLCDTEGRIMRKLEHSTQIRKTEHVPPLFFIRWS